jgi:hypothetical protein
MVASTNFAAEHGYRSCRTTPLSLSFQFCRSPNTASGTTGVPRTKCQHINKSSGVGVAECNWRRDKPQTTNLNVFGSPRVLVFLSAELRMSRVTGDAISNYPKVFRKKQIRRDIVTFEKRGISL